MFLRNGTNQTNRMNERMSSSALLLLVFGCVVLTFGCTEELTPREQEPKEDGGASKRDTTSGSDALSGDQGVKTDQPTTTVEHSCESPAAEWLLCEDFESGGGDFDTWRAGSPFNAGTGTDDRGRITLDTEQVHGGSHALYMPAAASSQYKGAALGWRKCQGPHDVAHGARAGPQPDLAPALQRDRGR